MSAARFDPETALELSLEEILEDLCWPHPPPGRWGLDAGPYSARGRNPQTRRELAGWTSHDTCYLGGLDVDSRAVPP